MAKQEIKRSWRQTIYTRKMDEAHLVDNWCQTVVHNPHHPNRNPVIPGIIGSGLCQRIPKHIDEVTNEKFCERHWAKRNQIGHYQKPTYFRNPTLEIHKTLENLSIQLATILTLTTHNDFQDWWKKHQIAIISNSELMANLNLSQEQTLRYLTYSQQYAIAQEHRKKIFDEKEKRKQLVYEQNQLLLKQIAIEAQEKKLILELEEKQKKEDIARELEKEAKRKLELQEQELLKTRQIEKEQKIAQSEVIKRENKRNIDEVVLQEILRRTQEDTEKAKEETIIATKKREEADETARILQIELKKQQDEIKKINDEIEKGKNIQKIIKTIDDIQFYIDLSEKIKKSIQSFPIEEQSLVTPLFILINSIDKKQLDEIQQSVTNSTIVPNDDVKKLLKDVQSIFTLKIDTNSKFLEDVNQIYEKNLNQPVRIYLRVNISNPEKLKEIEKGSDKGVIPYSVARTANQVGSKITYNEKAYGPFFSIFPHTFSNGNSMIYDASTTVTKIHNIPQDAVNEPMKGVFDLLSTGYNVTLCGYGFSGTGKTFTLFGSQEDKKEEANPYSIPKEKIPGIIQLGLSQLPIKAEFYSVFEIYGKITDITTSNRKSIVTLYHYFGEPLWQSFENFEMKKASVVNETNIISDPDIYQDFQASNLDALFNIIEQHRIKAGRIKQTPNNPQSSRGHLFFIVKLFIIDEFMSTDDNIKKTTSKISYFTLIDMAGAENPEAIAKTYFKLEDEYKFTDLLKDIANLSTTTSQLGTKQRQNLGTHLKDKHSKPESLLQVNKAIDTIQEGFYINDSLNELTYFLKNHQYQKKLFDEEKTIVTLPLSRNSDFPYYDPKTGYHGESIFPINNSLTGLPWSMSLLLTQLSHFGGESTLTKQTEVWKLNDGRTKTIILGGEPTYSPISIPDMKLQYILLVLLKADEDILAKEPERIEARIKTLEFADKFKIEEITKKKITIRPTV
jgi:kinesin motor protein